MGVIWVPINYRSCQYLNLLKILKQQEQLREEIISISPSRGKLWLTTNELPLTFSTCTRTKEFLAIIKALWLTIPGGEWQRATGSVTGHWEQLLSVLTLCCSNACPQPRTGAYCARCLIQAQDKIPNPGGQKAKRNAGTQKARWCIQSYPANQIPSLSTPVPEPNSLHGTIAWLEKTEQECYSLQLLLEGWRFYSGSWSKHRHQCSFSGCTQDS